MSRRAVARGCLGTAILPALGGGLLSGVLLVGQLESPWALSDAVVTLQVWIQLGALTGACLAAAAWIGPFMTAARAFLAFAAILWAVTSRAHFEFFGVGLATDTLSLSVDALRSQVVTFPVRLVLPSLVVLLVAASVGAWISFNSVRGPTETAARTLRNLVFYGVLGTASAWLPLPTQGLGPIVAELLPWMPSQSHAYASLALRDASGRPQRVELAEMQDQARFLREHHEPLISGLTASRPRSIVWVILESFRADLVSPANTPFLSSLREDCIHPESHYSSGANTGSGLFGLLHGLSLLHLPAFVASGQPPLPLEILRRLGYKRRLYAGFDLSYAGLDRLYFQDSFDQFFLEPPGTPVASDAALLGRLQTEQREAPDPTFDLIFLYSTHWGYAYPPSFERSLPVSPPDLEVRNAGSRSELRKWALGLKNRQRNAAAYLDDLLRKHVAPLLENGDPPILIITGDHGEEFFERGRLGHTWGVNEEMVRVPLWMCIPGHETTRYQYTDHRDVFPTLLDALGVQLETERLMTGKSLLRFDPDRDVALTGIPRRRARFRMAAVGSAMKVHFLPFAALEPVRILSQNDEELVGPLPEAEIQGLLRRATNSRLLVR